MVTKMKILKRANQAYDSPNLTSRSDVPIWSAEACFRFGRRQLAGGCWGRLFRRSECRLEASAKHAQADTVRVLARMGKGGSKLPLLRIDRD